MSAKGKQVEKEDSLGDSSTGDTQLSLSAYVIIFGVFGGLVATTEVFFDFIPAWEILVSLPHPMLRQAGERFSSCILHALDAGVGRRAVHEPGHFRHLPAQMMCPYRF